MPVSTRRSPRSAPLLLLSLLAALLLVAVVAPEVSAQRAGAPELSLRTLFASPTFHGASFQSGRWAQAGPVIRYVERDSATGATHLIEFNLETDARTRLIDGRRLRRPDGEGLIQIEDYAYSADRSRVLLYTDSAPVWRLNTQGFYYVYDLGTGAVTPLSDRETGFQMFAKFDPAGQRVAFVRHRDLFLVDLASMTETRLTDSGAEGGIINGTFDWVYEEEFGLRDGFQWSPDGQHIAFFQLDESATREYQMIDVRPLYPDVFRYRYPKAGEANSEIRVGVIDTPAGGVGETRFFETGTWFSGDPDTEYLALMGWTPPVDGGHQVWMLRLNRDQNDLDLLYGHPGTGEVRVVLNEREDAWIDVETGFSDLDMGKITFLDDGEHFVWRSDRSGFSHLYLYRTDGTLVRQLTTGDWDVTSFSGIDEAAGAVYVTGTLESPFERHLYRVAYHDVDAAPVRITGEPGWHAVNTSSDLRYYIGTVSDMATPTVTRLYRIDGTAVATLQDNAALIGRVRALDLPAPEWIRIPAADGTPLNGYLVKPRDFDAGREYPLMLFTYGGPGSQSVRNAWLGVQHLWHHWLAEEHGILVAVVDNRGTGGRGKEFKAQIYRRLGVVEAEDKIAVARHLGALPYVDDARLGIWGWSYGGYLALMAMLYEQGPETFKLGAAVAPVTSWRFYDTIYTERYLSTPQNNPAGYDLGSPLTYAANLGDHQRLLLVHGDFDDNVHVQNTVAMAEALIAADKQFELMLYPGRNHGIFGGNTRHHLFTLLSRFITENL
jgi:dipeptidyl-peptidase 4